jgi:hypothetical protein
MTHSQTRVLFCCIALLSIGACKQANDSSNSPSTNAQPSGAALREQSASEEAAAKNAKRVRAQELTVLISTEQAKRELLAQNKSNIEAQLAAYQADSTATLDQLKAEMQALQREKLKATSANNAKKMDAFSERARNQVEHALAMDQEYQAQLKQTDDDLENVDKRIATMRAEEKSLQAEIRN